MKVLHVTAWYPNRWNALETPFIREHFAALEGRVDQELWHVQVRNEGSWFRLFSGSTGSRQHFLILDTRITVGRVQELLTLCLLALLRIRLGRRRWDVVNAHVAFPLMRFPHAVRALYGQRVVITEHWSAYRSGFQLPDGSKAKRRIQQIFHHRIPVVTVSRALMNDIVAFCETSDFPQFIVPNVVDPALFHLAPTARSTNASVFLMVASWAPIKRPLLAMAAFSAVLADFPNAQLRIVGYGPQWEQMQAYVRDNDLARSIVFLGGLPKSSIAKELQAADCLLHASDYETFSVVCAEALCCGVPVIASRVGGIPEFVDDSNGILVDNTAAAWVSALRQFLTRTDRWDAAEISQRAIANFSPDVIAEKLVAVYSACRES